MKRRNSLFPGTSMLLLFSLTAVLAVSSCKESTPGQSRNWKVVVSSIKKIPKNPNLSDEIMKQYDTLEIWLNFEYTGPPGDIKSPTVSLIDGNGRRFECLSFGLSAAPGEYLPGPLEKGYRENQNERKEMMRWVDPIARAWEKKPRSLKGGERFYVVYSFEDPKQHADLKLVFNDAAPLPLKVENGTAN